MSQDEHGLAFEAELPDTSFARDLRESVRRGDVDGASFRFVVGEEHWSDDVREIRSVKELHDLTIATVPAYPATSIELRARGGDGGGARSESNSHALSVPVAEPTLNDPATPVGKEHDMEAEDRKVEGGLAVEDRAASGEDAGIEETIVEFVRGTRRGEARALTTSVGVSQSELSTRLFRQAAGRVRVPGHRGQRDLDRQ